MSITVDPIRSAWVRLEGMSFARRAIGYDRYGSIVYYDPVSIRWRDASGTVIENQPANWQGIPTDGYATCDLCGRYEGGQVETHPVTIEDALRHAEMCEVTQLVWRAKTRTFDEAYELCESGGVDYEAYLGWYRDLKHCKRRWDEFLEWAKGPETKPKRRRRTKKEMRAARS